EDPGQGSPARGHAARPASFRRASRAAWTAHGLPRLIPQIDGATLEAALVQEVEVESQPVGQRPRAPADGGRDEEQLDLVDDPRPQRVRGEARPADRD